MKIEQRFLVKDDYSLLMKVNFAFFSGNSNIGHILKSILLLFFSSIDNNIIKYGQYLNYIEKMI